MRIDFLGGTGTVTGSKYLLTHEGRRLLVDCGLFQGLKQLRLRNWDELPVDPAGIDAVLLTHAHMDHSGFVPRLVRLGFKGRVYCSAATRELCELLLPDSGRLQEEDADFANRHGRSKHKPALPLYTEEDARAALKRFEPVGFAQECSPWPGWSWQLRRAGHILGAASLRIGWEGSSILFSGDLGRSDDLLMRPPEAAAAADYVVVESTYGDRRHPAADTLSELAGVINRTAARGGIVVIPAFAVGRAQTLLHCTQLLKQARRIPDMPVYLNSPMAADATRIYRRHLDEHRLSAEQCAAMQGKTIIVNTIEESRRLNSLGFPSIIVSASGMATGGRVLHHLKAYAPDARNTILFAGFQAAGTRGAAMVGGVDAIKIHGAYVPVRAEVANLETLSAHADRDELLAWLGTQRAPRRVFVTHGEPVAADALRLAIEERHGWPCTVPDYRESREL
ncbi:MBL fold metallo-hydrolase [Variovorax sp. NFACC27]|uniref:MBL fold metallo-hydrolase RNA specificity domain-containing protein n=1 Tax=unclassified Variovorax TaxID=663243 RepID=UPI00089942DD|nr:MBL fold metallo-hydrolase [Variovorax sp. YR750]SEF20956.1 metallo-beta-lactamase family protein [Variovorax sp. NFACC28]SEF50923.1 metallo-beta-lactamase family protein [Variovorax sp. NFACC29]SFB68224.1 metallo-beta-lactamase family protein [Variovorax sp. NFACC26]SFG49802.1 metallo-beta-lactamase family protein [Variovorax sp. NFACC27]SEK85259.1 metallo-beta-lactamase family protein [Variovorax sp. YR750]